MEATKIVTEIARTDNVVLRKCNICGLMKQLSEFAKDPTKTCGSDYTCKECKREQDRLRRKRRKNFPPRRPKREASRISMMTDEIFKVYYENADLRDFIEAHVRRHSKRDRDFQDDLKQIAWMHIAMCEGGKTIEYYKEIAKKAIHNEYRKQYEKREYNLTDLEAMSRAEYEMWRSGIHF